MSSKKRIAFFNSYKIWGGGEKWHFEMADYVCNKGHQVFVFTPSDGELYKRMQKHNPDVTLVDIEVTKHSYWNPLTQLKFRQKFKESDADVVVFNSIVDVRAAAVAAMKGGVSRRIYRAGMPAPPKEKSSYLKAFNDGLTEMVGISFENIDIVRRKSPRLMESLPTRILTNGIDMQKFRPNPDISVIRQRPEQVVFGNCTRLSDQKGLDMFLDVVASLKAHDIHVLLAGEGESKESLVTQRDQLGLSEYVDFVGFVEQTESFYPQIDFLLFTSKFEGSARTLIEAMACGLPVIAFDTSSMSEMIVHGENGLLVPPFDLTQMAKYCRQLIEDKSLRTQMGQKAREHALKHYDQDKIYQQWFEHLCS